VSDIFREVEEEVRRERLEQLWKEYGDYVLAGIAVLLLAVAGWQVWRYYEQRARLQASDEFTAAQALLDSNRADQAATAFAKLADSAPGGYAVVSRLANADALEAAGNHDEALALYKRIATGDDPLLASVARLREGWILVGTAPRLEIETLLAPLTDPNSEWRYMAREILAFADYRAKKFDVAEREYEALAVEQEAPIGVRQRANAMAAFLKAGGDADYGSVPAAGAAAPATAPVAPAPAKAASSPKAKPSKAKPAQPHKKGRAHK
jgi:hypothetical protein